jgi:hypothetical protein
MSFVIGMNWVKILRFINPKAALIVSILLFALISTQALAQIKVSGGFLSDSLKIGEQTAFYLAAKYPSNVTILYPDSAHGFAPFEYETKRYFATETTNGISTDSTIYYLTTFELGDVQALQLPVYAVNELDCTAYRSNVDSIRLVQLLKAMPDSISIDKLPLKETTAYEDVNYQFNYFILLIVLVVLVVLLVIVWIIFGKRISQYFKAKRLQKNHNQFVESYNRTLSQVSSAFSSTTAESALSLWKKYMEQLEARPYTKLTTRETLMLQNDEMLGKSLKSIDMAIYGHNTSVVDPLEKLKHFADERFRKKFQEVKDGK